MLFSLCNWLIYLLKGKNDGWIIEVAAGWIDMDHLICMKYWHDLFLVIRYDVGHIQYMGKKKTSKEFVY